MQECFITRLRLKRMAEGVTEIQNLSQPVFPFIRRYDFRFGAHGFGHNAIHHLRVLREDIAAAFGEQPEERLACDNAGLDDLIETGSVFALGERREHGGIDQDRKRLMERSDEIFTGYKIRSGLASDRRVHLREQGGGNLHNGYAAHEDRREKTAEIGYDAAAECYDDTGAIGSAFGHLHLSLIH